MATNWAWGSLPQFHRSGCRVPAIGAQRVYGLPHGRMMCLGFDAYCSHLPSRQKVKSGFSSSVRHALQAMPTVKFDPSTVTKSVKADLRRNIELLDDLEKKHVPHVYQAALRSVSAGRDLNVLFLALMKIEGMSKGRAAEIARSLNDKATAIINRERQASLGITHANGCMRTLPA